MTMNMKLIKIESSNEMIKNKKIILEEKFIIDNNKFKEFINSLQTILIAGIGDKSFIITIIMASKYPHLPVFFSSLSSLILMGYISVHLGLNISIYLPRYWVDITSVFVFIILGIKLNADGIKMTRKNEEDNLANIQNEFKKQFFKENEILAQFNKKENEEEDKQNKIKEYLEIFVQVFILICITELGDKSQISTIYINSNSDIKIIYYALATSQIILTCFSVLIGRLIYHKFNQRTLTFAASVIFLAFGIISGYLTYINDYVLINKTFSDVLSQYDQNPHFQKIPKREIITNHFLKI